MTTLQAYPDMFADIWASTGDKVKPTDAAYKNGELINTEPSRTRFNYMLYNLDKAVNYILQRGIAEWKSGQSYALNSHVVDPSTGIIYRALVNNSVSLTDATKWIKLFDYAEIAEVVATGAAPRGKLVTSGLLYDYVLQEINKTNSRQVPVGMMAYCHSRNGSVPTGWLIENGAELSRTTYADLWAYAQAVGVVTDAVWWANNFGAFSSGNGTTTFRIPRMLGVYARGANIGTGLDTRRGNENTQVGSYRADQVLTHAHGVSDPGHAHSVYDPGHAHGDDHVHNDDHYHTTNQATYVASTTGGIYGLLSSGQQYIAQLATNSKSAQGYGATTAWKSQSGSGASTAAAGTGIGIYGAGTGISINAAGSAENAVRDIALLPMIKF